MRTDRAAGLSLGTTKRNRPWAPNIGLPFAVSARMWMQRSCLLRQAALVPDVHDSQMQYVQRLEFHIPVNP